MKKFASLLCTMMLVTFLAACSTAPEAPDAPVELEVQVVSGLADSKRIDRLEITAADGATVASRADFLNRLVTFELPRSDGYTVEAYVKERVSRKSYTVRVSRTIALSADRDIVMDVTPQVIEIWGAPDPNHHRTVHLILDNPFESSNPEQVVTLTDASFDLSGAYGVVGVSAQSMDFGRVGETYQFEPVPLGEAEGSPVIRLTVNSYRACDALLGTLRTTQEFEGEVVEETLDVYPSCKG